MREYWKQRAIDLENLLQDKTTATIVELNKLYAEANQVIAAQIEKIFAAYKKGGQLDSAHALQLLTAGQTAQQRQALLKLLSKTTEPKARQKMIRILDAPAYADRISRLQALSDYITVQAIRLGEAEKIYTETRLRDVAKNAYYRSIYYDQHQEGRVYDFEKLSDKRLQSMLAHKWSGKNYSDRIWKNNQDFIKRLQRTVELGCMTGMSLKEMEDRILEDCIGTDSDSGQRYCASRLIRTEVNYFANHGMMLGYKEAGIARYRFLATLDLKTSEICRKLDLQVFPVAKAQAGTNCPPMHPFCRSVTVPDTCSRTGTRWARDPVTGRSVRVPANMTYSQWYEKYVLTDQEEYAINQYIGSKSYGINEKLRQKLSLTEEENNFIINLDSALKKMPEYQGDLNRSLIFDNKDDLNSFLTDYQVGNTIHYTEYLSTMKGSLYNPDGQVQIHILNSSKGRDISAYNPNECEVLYSRNNSFEVIQIEKQDDIIDIYVKEK